MASSSVKLTKKNYYTLGICFTFIFLLKRSARHGKGSIDGKAKEHPHSRRSQCNVSHQTGESTKAVDACIIKEHSRKVNRAKSSPPIPLIPSNRQKFTYYRVYAKMLELNAKC